MIGRGTVEAEEKRSFGALFLLVISLLVACAVWAIWQDTFSRHRWKKFKTDYYRLAIAKYEGDLVKDTERLAADEKYAALAAELAKLDEEGRDAKEVVSKIKSLQGDLGRAEVRVVETDLDLRFVKGEIEEAWYYFEKAGHEGKDQTEEQARLDKLFALKAGREEAAQAAIDARDGIQKEIDSIQARELEIAEEMRPFHKERELIAQRLDAVSLSVFGHRVPMIPTIDQVVVPGFERNNFEQWVDRVDRCTNCHVAINKVGFEEEEHPFKTHPDRAYYLGNHEKFGCTPCHGGQGPAINSVEQAHGEVPYWDDPLLTIKDKVQTKCLTCHPSVIQAKGAEIAARGETLFREMGCHGCHLVGGFEHLDKTGPSLKRIAAKADPEWLVSWVNKPHDFRSRTRMPDFLFDREQAIDISAYLLASSVSDAEAWLGAHPAPKGINPSDAALVKRGKELTENLGCLGCHGFEEDAFADQVAQGKDIAPNLARIAEKTDARWLYHWIENPRGFSDVARMPSLRLEDDEARAITSYLMTLKTADRLPADPELRKTLASDDAIARGEKLVRKYGCAGCHVVNGMEGESRIGVELSAFGGKHAEELDFGTRDDLPRTWDDWSINKILTPRTYATARIESVMPMFRFSEEDARSLVVFLASGSENVINPIYTADDDRAATILRGREVITRYNCQGCHSFDGREGAIRRFYDNLENAPPVLHGEGIKLQPAWFVDFLKRPVRLRPWLEVRMPSFGMSDDETRAVVDYFAALDGYELGEVVVQGAPGPDTPVVRQGGSVPDGYFDCGACHALDGGKLDPHRYVVSRTPLTTEQAEAWMAEHLDIEVGSGVEDKSAALRKLLGTDAGGM